jgi:hypothetical protein
MWLLSNGVDYILIIRNPKDYTEIAVMHTSFSDEVTF